MVERNVCTPEGCGPKEAEAEEHLAADFSGWSSWLNSEKISLDELKGKVVLVDFWTYTCINCIRTIPYLKDWHEKYADKGLVIIGVHTPEFLFEKKLANVKDAVQKFGIKYPVVQDNDFLIWKAYDNHYWPHKYLIDSEGKIRYDHIGEGGYEETEKEIVKLLQEIDSDVKMGIPLTARQESSSGQTPELYAGYKFARVGFGNTQGIKPDQVVTYELPDEILKDKITLQGKWLSNIDNLQHAENKKGKVVLRFTAKKVHLVGEALKEATKVIVLLNDKSLTNKNKGEDIVILNNNSYFTLDEGRLYNIVNLPEKSEGILTLIVEDKSFSFNAFTFGT